MPGGQHTLIVQEFPGAPWWPALRRGAGWAPFVVKVLPLGPAQSTLLGLSALYRDVFGTYNLLALRLDGRYQ